MNITFKSVMKIMKLLESNFNENFKTNKILDMLNIPKDDLSFETKSFILNKVFDYIFQNEEKQIDGERMFDLELDYKYYWVDFLDKGINLNLQDLPYWEFNSILEGIFLQEKSTIGQVLTYRGYKKPNGNYKSYQNEEHKFYMQKKRQYALPPKKETLEAGMDKMWEYLNEKAKEKGVDNNE